MGCETAVRRRLTRAVVLAVDHRPAFPQVKAGAVGLPGLEPGTSSLSGIEGSALCGPAFSQVAGERQGRRDAFLASRSKWFRQAQVALPLVRNSRMAEPGG